MGIYYLPSITAMFNKKAMMIWVMGYYFLTMLLIYLLSYY